MQLSRLRLPGLAVVVALLVGTRLFGGGELLLGSPGGEVYGHAWVQGWHAAALPDWPAGTGLAHGTGRWTVIDPLPTAFAALVGRLFGLAVGYDLLLLLGIVGAFLGGAWLARKEGGEPLVGGLVLALAPAWLGALSSGLTEDVGVGLVALGLGLVGRPGWRSGLAAGLCLGLLAWCGLVVAWFAGLAAVVLGLASLPGGRQRLMPLLLGAAIAALVAAPLLWVHAERLGGTGHRLGESRALVEPLWRLNPWRGVDLLSLVAPGRQDPGEALVRTHPGYLGLVALGLALVGGRSRWWWVLGLMVAISPGATLSFGGQPLSLRNPLHGVIGWLPGAALLNHHGRALIVGAVALSVLAARGASRLAQRWPRAGRVAAGAVLLDLLLLSPLPLPLPVVDIQPSPLVLRLSELPEGPLLAAPAGGPGVHFQRPLIDQRVHGRKLLLSPNQPGLPGKAGESEAGRWLASLSQPGAPPPPPPAAAFAALGASVLLVLPPWVDAVEAALGPPDLRDEGGAAWVLGRLKSADPSP